MADTTTLEEIVTPLKTLWRFDYDTNVNNLLAGPIESFGGFLARKL